MKLEAESDGVSDMALKPGDPVRAQHKPDLQRPETTAQRDLPVAVVDDQARRGERVAEESGVDGECRGQIGAFFYVETAGHGGSRSVGERTESDEKEKAHLASKLVSSHLCMFISKLSNPSKCCVTS